MNKSKPEGFNDSGVEPWVNFAIADPCVDGFPRVPGYTVVYKARRAFVKHSNVYAPTRDIKRADGRHQHNIAIGSRFSCFVYVHLKVTGRYATRVPGGEGLFGVKCRATFGFGEDNTDSVEAWLVRDHAPRDLTRANAQVLIERAQENTKG